jgi:hypothetical protein
MNGVELAVDARLQIWLEMERCQLLTKSVGGPGSGKTKSLIDAFVREVESGTEPERIVYVVFNRAARLMIRDRIKKELSYLFTDVEEGD